MLDHETHSRVRYGNAVHLLINGVESFRQRLENARDADLILVKTFIFGNDDVANNVADLLSERARAGAFVVVQYDVKGSIHGVEDLGDMLIHSKVDLSLGEKEIIRRMGEAGVIIVPTNKPGRWLQMKEWSKNIGRLFQDPLGAVARILQSLRLLAYADHEKFWITGKRNTEGRLQLRAIMGGLNIASEYAYGGTSRTDSKTKHGGWRDTDVEVRGPVVNEIVDRYFNVMEYHLGRWKPNKQLREKWNPLQDPVGDAKVRFIWNQPLIGNQRNITRLYYHLIEATPDGNPVRLETAYFAPGFKLRGALEDALRRGVRLTVLTNSRRATDTKAVSAASRNVYAGLLKVNPDAELLEHKPRPDIGETMLHSKVASFGVCGPVVVGSANLDARSSEHNSESVLLIDDSALRTSFDAMFLKDIQADRTVRVTPEVIARSSRLLRVKGWLWRYFGWYFL